MTRPKEALQICRAIYAADAPSFTVRCYRIDHALNYPRPIRAEGIPILVGGSDEIRMLALVARYADACNLFGDLDTIRHRFDVLAGPGAATGRDQVEITKTRLGALVIVPTDAEAARRRRLMVRAWGMDEACYRASAIAGGPDALCEQVGGYLEVGLDGMVFNLDNASDFDTVRLAGETLTRAFVSAGFRPDGRSCVVAAGLEHGRGRGASGGAC